MNRERRHKIGKLIAALLVPVVAGVAVFFITNPFSSDDETPTPGPDARVRITEPERNENVDPTGFPVRGDVADPPEGSKLWLFMFAPVAKKWYQIGGDPVPLILGGWETRLTKLGACGDKRGQAFRLRAYLYSESVSMQLKQAIDAIGQAPYEIKPPADYKAASKPRRVKLEKDFPCH